jgi:hypothetical protein
MPYFWIAVELLETFRDRIVIAEDIDDTETPIASAVAASVDAPSALWPVTRCSVWTSVTQSCVALMPL